MVVWVFSSIQQQLLFQCASCGLCRARAKLGVGQIISTGGPDPACVPYGTNPCSTSCIILCTIVMLYPHMAGTTIMRAEIRILLFLPFSTPTNSSHFLERCTNQHNPTHATFPVCHCDNLGETEIGQTSVDTGRAGEGSDRAWGKMETEDIPDPPHSLAMPPTAQKSSCAGQAPTLPKHLRRPHSDSTGVGFWRSTLPPLGQHCCLHRPRTTFCPCASQIRNLTCHCTGPTQATCVSPRGHLDCAQRKLTRGSTVIFIIAFTVAACTAFNYGENYLRSADLIFALASFLQASASSVKGFGMLMREISHANASLDIQESLFAFRVESGADTYWEYEMR